MSEIRKIEVKMEPKGLDMEIDKMEFALALKTWRLRAGLTQKQLGERWGMSRYTIIRAATVVTDGIRTKSFEWEHSQDHENLTQAIAYLEAQGYTIDTEEWT